MKPTTEQAKEVKAQFIKHDAINKNLEMNSGILERKRILSFDILKGFALMLIIWVHTELYSLKEGQRWFYYHKLFYIDIFGPSLFVLLSCLAVSYSIKMKKGKNDERDIRNSIVGKSIILLLFGFVGNYTTCLGLGFIFFWSWGPLQFIAFAQIATYYALKIKKHYRIIIATAILVLTPIIFSILTENLALAGIDYKRMNQDDILSPFNINAFIYFLIFNQHKWQPILPWIALPFIISIVGESLAKSVKNGSHEELKRFNIRILLLGIFFLLLGMILGMELTKDDLGWFFWNHLSTSPYYNLDGMPVFIVRSTIPNILYNLGTSHLLLALSFYLFDLKNIRGKIVNFLSFYGTVSLSLYIWHSLFIQIFYRNLSILESLLYVSSIWMLLAIILYIWVRKFNWIMSFEWMIKKSGLMFQDFFKKRRKK